MAVVGLNDPAFAGTDGLTFRGGGPNGLQWATNERDPAVATRYFEDWARSNLGLGPVNPVVPPGAAMPVRKRNPVIDQIIQQTIQQAAGAAGNPVPTVTQIPKSGAMAPRISGLFAQNDASAPLKKQSLSDYTRELLAKAPGAARALNQESDSVNRVFSTGPGSYGNDLDRSRARRRAAVNMAAQAAAKRAGLSNNLARMGGGNNSYLDQAYAGQLQDIFTGTAIQDADLDRSNLMEVRGQQNNLLGRRQAMIQNYLQALLNPYQNSNNLQMQDQDVLANLGQLEAGNSIFDVMTPDQRVGRQVGLIDSISDLDNMLYN